MGKFANTLNQAEHLALLIWRRGYTAALASFSQWGEDTIYDEAVEASGEPDELIRQARKDGAMRWSGLSGYVKRQKENGR